MRARNWSRSVMSFSDHLFSTGLNSNRGTRIAGASGRGDFVFCYGHLNDPLFFAICVGTPLDAQRSIKFVAARALFHPACTTKHSFAASSQDSFSVDFLLRVPDRVIPLPLFRAFTLGRSSSNSSWN